MFQANKDAILRAILAAGLPPLAAEEASVLVEAWVDTWAEQDAENWTIEASEMPFYLWLDAEKTALCIGVSDLRGRDAEGGFHAEWKSATPPKPRARWGEESWIADLSNGPQLAVYGLAQREGRFLDAVVRPNETLIVPGWIDGERTETAPRLFVRVCLKSSPPAFWPSTGGVFQVQFDHAGLNRVKAALLNEARAIQARRRTEGLPWMYPGNQCTNKYGRVCDSYEDCKTGKYPPIEKDHRFSSSDPGGQVLEHVQRLHPESFESPDLVILSASAYSDAQQCPELYRRRNLCRQPKEESYALNVGRGMHAGLAELYTQVREWQQNPPSQIALDTDLTL